MNTKILARILATHISQLNRNHGERTDAGRAEMAVDALDIQPNDMPQGSPNELYIHTLRDTLRMTLRYHGFGYALDRDTE